MTKTWEFKKLQKNATRTVEITVELRDEDDHLGAYADDSYYYGDLTKEESIDLARAVLAKLDPSEFPVGAHARVVDGAMCGVDGFIVGTVKEDGYVILRCRDGILLQPPRFVRVGP
jgi:hypothetical protein